MFLTSLDQLLHFKMAWDGHVQQVSLFRHAHHEFSSKAKQKKSLERSTHKTKQNKTKERKEKKRLPIPFFRIIFSYVIYLFLSQNHFSTNHLRHQFFWSLSVGVLIKGSSGNMQQIYRRTLMSKCDFNKVAKQLRHGYSPVNLVHIFRAPFPRNTTLALSLHCSKCLMNSVFAAEHWGA